jgi:NAD(P)-dependent dehydrogenase (short-subunit alcohol dehydrogenase family)
MTVANKVVLVTGGARGLGREYVVSLARQGAKVVAGDVLDCAATVATARDAGGQAIGVRLDVTDMDSVAAMAHAALDACGTIDALVNNAALYGALRGGRFNAIAEADWVIRAGQAIPHTPVPGDLSGTVAWLISDASRFVTGQAIAVDGGTVLL